MLDPMPRKKDPTLPGLVQCNIRMPQPVLDELDAWVEEANREAGWGKYTRTDMIRSSVDEALARRRKKEEAKR
jgi:Arc/MetJ-type ribon-helix-helix transcriptional regulator